MPRVDELPEVADLVEAGWVPFDASGYQIAILAAWPPELRGWVEDRRPKVIVRVWMDGRREVVPASGRGDPHEEMCETAAECGLPAPPRGRVWLLRSPWSVLGVSVVVRMIWLRLAGDGSGPAAVLAVAREILAMTADEVWQALTPEMRASAEAWSAVGRSGEDVADLVCRGLHPAHLERLRAAGSVGEVLTEAQAAAWVGAVASMEVDTATAVERVALWRELGVGAPDGDRWPWPLSDMSPTEARAWLEAGFTVDDLETWLGVDLAGAKEWRSAGFEGGVARDLLLADARLTPVEARAFDAAGVDPEARPRWVATGSPRPRRELGPISTSCLLRRGYGVPSGSSPSAPVHSWPPDVTTPRLSRAASPSAGGRWGRVATTSTTGSLTRRARGGVPPRWGGTASLIT